MNKKIIIVGIFALFIGIGLFALKDKAIGTNPYVLREIQGGTGTSTPSNFLFGNSGEIESVAVGSGLTLTNNVLSASAAGSKYSVFGYGTSTAWTGTTTLYIGPAGAAQTWVNIKCETDTGTVNVSVYDGTNRMEMVTASTTIGTNPVSTNNSFTSSESRRVDFGSPASTPTFVACTGTYNLD